MKHEFVTGFSGRKWPQVQSELAEFIALLQAEGVRSYLEIGCLYGDTFHAVGMALPEGARLVAVDLPGWKHGQPIGRHPHSGEYLKRAGADLSRRGRKVDVLLGDSHDVEVVNAVAALGPFDAVLIDGDHTPEGCAEDWRDYGPLGRIVAFHDIAGIPAVRSVFETARQNRLWREIVAGEPKGGIGIVWNT
ncbi:MAG: class I SAM-dependent methyltransferase [Dichotomicrobium sp.]